MGVAYVCCATVEMSNLEIIWHSIFQFFCFFPFLTFASFFSFAFVEFESTDDAKDALENLNNTDIEGRSIRLEYSQNSGRGDGGRGNSGRSWISASYKIALKIQT